MLKSNSLKFVLIVSPAFVFAFPIISSAQQAAPDPNIFGPGLWYLLTFLIGVFVGMTEILSRYRDDPWKASVSGPGFVYMLANGLLSVGAYWIIVKYQIFPGIEQPGFPAAMVAGFGSMAVMRSKFFVYTSEDGKDVSVGPEIVLDIFMKTVDKQIDRKQAIRRQKLITQQLEGIMNFSKVVEYFDTAILSFQHMTPEDTQGWKQEMEKLDASDLPEKVKIYALGYALLNITGEGHFKHCVEELKKYINGNSQDEPASTPSP